MIKDNIFTIPLLLSIDSSLYTNREERIKREKSLQEKLSLKSPTPSSIEKVKAEIPQTADPHWKEKLEIWKKTNFDLYNSQEEKSTKNNGKKLRIQPQELELKWHWPHAEMWGTPDIRLQMQLLPPANVSTKEVWYVKITGLKSAIAATKLDFSNLKNQELKIENKI